MPNAAGFLQGCLVRLHRHWHRFAPNFIKLGKGMIVPYIVIERFERAEISELIA